MRFASLLRSVAAPVFFCLSGAAVGCATTQAVPESGRVVEAPEMRVVAEPIGPDGLEVYDAEILFERGLDLLSGDAWADAALYFERLIREFPDDKHVVLAHFNRGVAYIHQGRGDEAVAAFDAYLALLPPHVEGTAYSRDRLDGIFKRGQALAVAKRFTEVVEVFDLLLVEDLEVQDRIEALVDAGIGHYMLGLNDKDGDHRSTAEYRFLEARRLHRKASERARIDVAYHVAQASFYLAELSRLEFSEYELRYPTAAEIAAAKDKTLEQLLGEQLEEKCQRLLRAQYAYLRTIREGHAGWAGAAGFNVGAMYEELHGNIATLPAPDDLSPEAKALYEKMVRKKILILLEKALKTWESTADMVVRTGAESEWSEKTRQSLERVRQKILQEQAATAQEEGESNVASVEAQSKG